MAKVEEKFIPEASEIITPHSPELVDGGLVPGGEKESAKNPDLYPDAAAGSATKERLAGSFARAAKSDIKAPTAEEEQRIEVASKARQYLEALLNRGVYNIPLQMAGKELDQRGLTPAEVIDSFYNPEQQPDSNSGATEPTHS